MSKMDWCLWHSDLYHGVGCCGHGERDNTSLTLTVLFLSTPCARSLYLSNSSFSCFNSCWHVRWSGWTSRLVWSSILHRSMEKRHKEVWEQDMLRRMQYSQRECKIILHQAFRWYIYITLTHTLTSPSFMTKYRNLIKSSISPNTTQYFWKRTWHRQELVD